jgi:hypothetical protein
VANLTGGTVPWPVDTKQYEARGPIYSLAEKAGWTPSTPHASTAFTDATGKTRVMSTEERRKFLLRRGSLMKEMVLTFDARLNPEQLAKRLQSAEKDARAKTLRELNLRNP